MKQIRLIANKPKNIRLKGSYGTSGIEQECNKRLVTIWWLNLNNNYVEII